MTTPTTRKIIAVLIALMFFVSGCDPTGRGSRGVDEVSGRITVSGAWALYPMMIKWGEEFQKTHPEVQFDISAGGAGKGMADALAGAVDIGMVSRNIYPEEIEKGAFWVAVTKDAVFLTVNEQNPFWEELHQKGVSPQTLEGIFITGEVTTWGQVIGRPEITDPIHVFTRSDACGAAETWAQFLDHRQEDLLGIGVFGDPGVIDAVIKDPLAIGFNNLNYAYAIDTGQPMPGARIPPLDINRNGVADPQEIMDNKDQAISAIALGYYPSPPARDLHLVTQGAPTGLARAFITWVLTNGQQFVGEWGYIPLSEERLNEELSKLE